MKFDLTTSVVVGIVGVVIAFFVANLFIPEIEAFSFKALSSAPSTTLTDPNPEVFNFRAINPTVEVYVGQCEEYDANGNCASIVTEDDNASFNTTTTGTDAESTTMAEEE